MKDLIPIENNNPLVSAEREGIFKQGFDKKGRPYEIKVDTNGVTTKKEILLTGEKKLTIKTR